MHCQVRLVQGRRGCASSRSHHHFFIALIDQGQVFFSLQWLIRAKPELGCASTFFIAVTYKGKRAGVVQVPAGSIFHCHVSLVQRSRGCAKDSPQKQFFVSANIWSLSSVSLFLFEHVHVTIDLFFCISVWHRVCFVADFVLHGVTHFDVFNCCG